MYIAPRILLKFTVIRLFSIWLGKACQKVPEGRSNKIFVDRKHGREEAAEKHSGAEAEEVGMLLFQNIPETMMLPLTIPSVRRDRRFFFTGYQEI